MTVTIPTVILFAAALLAIGILIHKFWPGSAVAKAEDRALTAAEKFEPSLEALGMQALTKAELWLTDDSRVKLKREQAAQLITEANQEDAARLAALRAHVTSLSARLPAA